MLLTVGYIVRPVTWMNDIIVKKREGTLLNSCSSIPTLPVSSARSCMREDSILPLAIFTANRLLSHHSLSIWASYSVRVIAVRYDSSLRSSKGKSVGTSLKDGFACRWVAFVVVVTVFIVGKESSVVLIVVSTKLRCRWGCSLSLDCTRKKGQNVERMENEGKEKGDKLMWKYSKDLEQKEDLS